MILRGAGFESIPVLVRFSGTDPIPDSRVDLVLFDYGLNSVTTAPEIAQKIRPMFPEAPIILLSDPWPPPADVAPFINQFVRKGEPAKVLGLGRHSVAFFQQVTPKFLALWPHLNVIFREQTKALVQNGCRSKPRIPGGCSL
jgi:hypothetical protein